MELNDDALETVAGGMALPLGGGSGGGAQYHTLDTGALDEYQAVIDQLKSTGRYGLYEKAYYEYVSKFSAWLASGSRGPKPHAPNPADFL